MSDMQSNDSAATTSTSQESEVIHSTIPKKKSRDKKKKVPTTYTYKKEWKYIPKYSRWVKRSRMGDLYYHCKICNFDGKCSTEGRYSLTVHNNSVKHKKNSAALEKTKEIESLQAQGSMNQSVLDEASTCSPSTSNTQMTGKPAPPVATSLPTAALVKTKEIESLLAQGSMNQSVLDEASTCSPSTSNTQVTVRISAPPVATSLPTDINTKEDTTLIDVCSSSSYNPLQSSIISAKIKMSWYLAKRKLRLDKTKDLGNLIQSICPDSEIAKHLTLKETEAQSIISDITGNIAQKALMNTLIKEKFSLIIEENSNQSTKNLTVMVRTAVDFKVRDQFLVLIPLGNSNSNHVYEFIKDYFNRNKIPYKHNMIGLAAEASCSIFRTEESFARLLKEDLPNLFLLKCVRNSFLICVSHACKKILPEDFKNFLTTQINKKKELKCSENVEEVVLEYQTVTQLNSEKYNPITRLYLEFLSFLWPCFNKVNMEMQPEVPNLHKLYKYVIQLHKEILDCFIQKELLAHDEDEEQEIKLLTLDYDSIDNHLPTQNIYLGGNVSFLLLNESFIAKLSNDVVNTFKETCKKIFIETIKQVRQRFSFKVNEIKRLNSLTFLDPKHLIKKESVDSIAQIGYFKGLCPSNMTELDREWRELRNHKSLSNYVLTINAQDFWKDVSEMKKDNLQLYPKLSQLTRSLFALPCSSTANERIISSINMLAATIQNRQTEMLQGLLYVQSLNNNSEPTEEHINLFNKWLKN